MQRELIKDLLKQGQEAQKAQVCGWVRSKRVSKSVAFLVIHDGSCQQTLQIVIDASSQAFQSIESCTTGAAIYAKGQLKASQGQNQSWELLADSLQVLGTAPTDYPLQKKGHSLEFLREIGHLRPRTNTFGAVFRIRNAVARGVHNFFQSRDFLWVHTPIVTASDCEGAGEMFTVTTLDLNKPPQIDGKVDFGKDFFGKQARLTVSGQLEAEFMAMSMGNVYTFGPTFRAENSNTTRHLAEFWMIEPEMAFADLTDDMRLAEDFVHSLCSDVATNCIPELEFLGEHFGAISVTELDKLSKAPFHRITYTDAVEELIKSGRKFEYPVKWGQDLQSEHERFLTDEIFKGPVIVYNYPLAIKPFYMRVNDDEKTVAAMDVLVPKIGELIGGSQREERLDILTRRMEQLSVNTPELNWYVDLRRFGTAPHAGFGLGFERLIQYVTGMSNIRDVIPCPRAPQLIDF